MSICVLYYCEYNDPPISWDYSDIPGNWYWLAGKYSADGSEYHEWFAGPRESFTSIKKYIQRRFDTMQKDKVIIKYKLANIAPPAG